MAEYIEREKVVFSILGLTIVDSAVAAYADAVLHRVQSIPAADVAPVRHSRWVHCFQQDGETVGQCYECHAIRFVDPYCPNCGAKMD